MSHRRSVALALGLLAGLLVALLIVTGSIARPWRVAGRSMEPTLRPGDRVVVDVWSYRHRSPRPGEIVLFVGPEPGRAPLIKRCVRTPSGVTPRSHAGPWGSLRHPDRPGSWLRGDNSGDSWDSSSFGAVPGERILGRVVWRYWPTSRWGPVR